MGHDLGDRFYGVMDHAFATLCTQGVAGLPEFPLTGLDKGMDRKVVYCDRLMRHCEHVSSRCDEIAQLLDMMLETHDQLDGGEAEFDRLAGLIAGEDAAADHAIREYDRALDRKINLRRVLRSVMSEGVVVKFASISYTLRPTKGGRRIRRDLSQSIEAMSERKSQSLSDPDVEFGEVEQEHLIFLKKQRDYEELVWPILRIRRGEDLAALFEPLIEDLLPYLKRGARDQIVHFDERIDTNETRSEQISFADLSPAELSALRLRVAQLGADSEAVSAGIWRFRNRLPEA